MVHTQEGVEKLCDENKVQYTIHDEEHEMGSEADLEDIVECSRRGWAECET